MIGLVLVFHSQAVSRAGKTMNRAMNNLKFGISSILFAELTEKSSERWQLGRLDWKLSTETTWPRENRFLVEALFIYAVNNL
jgi:hypothetical protein